MPMDDGEFYDGPTVDEGHGQPREGMFDDDRDTMYAADKAEHLRAERDAELRSRARYLCDECGGAMEELIDEERWESERGDCLTAGCPCSRAVIDARPPFDPEEYRRFLAALPF